MASWRKPISGSEQLFERGRRLPEPRRQGFPERVGLVIRLLVLLGLLAAACAPLVSMAQSATPVPSFSTAAPQMDLAAMTLAAN